MVVSGLAYKNVARRDLPAGKTSLLPGAWCLVPGFSTLLTDASSLEKLHKNLAGKNSKPKQRKKKSNKTKQKDRERERERETQIAKLKKKEKLLCTISERRGIVGKSSYLLANTLSEDSRHLQLDYIFNF